MSKANAPRSNELTDTRDEILERALFDENNHVLSGINFAKYDRIPVKATGANIPKPIHDVCLCLDPQLLPPPPPPRPLTACLV